MMRLSHLMTGLCFLAFLAMLACSSSDAPTTASPSPTAPFTFGATSLLVIPANPQDYPQVDRMGQPAIATAFLGKTYPYLNSTQRDAFNNGNPSTDGPFFDLMMTGPQDRSLLLYHYELGPEIQNSLSGSPLYLRLCSTANGITLSDIVITKCQKQLRDGDYLPNPILPGGSDVITYDFSKPAGWPNGRTFDDPVVDRLLAASLLDLDEATTGMTINTLVGYLSPRQDESGTPSPASFPHLRPASPAGPSCAGDQATYARSASEITVICTKHGFQAGSLVVLDFTSGLGSDGVYPVTLVLNNNQFTVTDWVTGATSGNVTVSLFP